ncbi:MAG: hypothetical protein ABIA08_01600 [bacterium]
MKKTILGIVSLALVIGLAGIVSADVNAVTPSTNDINRTNGWAHVDQLSKGVGTTDLQFISTRAFWSCFEYRTDGDTSQKIGDTNYNTDITDGLYPYYCQSNNDRTKTITANEYVEVRMVFGAETDERFDWTRFDVLYPRTAEITSPTSGQDVYGTVDFTAFLNDDDADSVQWAVRQGTCAAGTNTVFGNVDGHSDIATIDTSDLSNQTFSFTGDMSSLPLGMYCFIYNPVEDSGESNIRETMEFNLIEPPVGPPIDKNECKKDGWMSFNNPTFKNQGDCVSYVQSNENAGKRD